MGKIYNLMRVFLAPATGTASSPVAITIDSQQEIPKMKAYLRIKIKSLAAEARIIRHAELHWRERGRYQLRNQKDSSRAYTTFHGLMAHRHEIAVEQRAALIAYGFLRGRAYRQIENLPHDRKPPFSRKGPDWTRVAEIIVKFGEGKYSIKTLQDELKVWREVPLQQAA